MSCVSPALTGAAVARARPVRREQKQRQDEDQIPERGERTDQPLVRPRRHIDRHDRVETEQRLAGVGIGDDEAGDENKADQPSDITSGPADARQHAEPLVGDERGHHGVVEHGGELGPDDGEAEEEKHDRRHAGLPRMPRATTRKDPTTSSTENPAIHGLRRRPASAMEPSIGASSAAISSAPPVA